MADTRKRGPKRLRFRISRPRTLLSLTLVGLGLVTLPLLIGVGTAALKLSDLMEKSSQAVIASTNATSGSSFARR